LEVRPDEMDLTSREFQIFVKPVGARCNLGCSYCYYLDRDLHHSAGSRKVMTREVLEKYIRDHLEAATGPVVMFSWHGGEPTLAGTGFYRKAVEIQKKYCPEGTRILNGMQTNGTLLDEAWCEFLAQEGFMVGISMDGPRELHDRFRVSKDGRPSFQRMFRGYELLRAYGVHTEILCVVNALNVGYPLEVYRFFKEVGARYLTFIPLVEPENGTSGIVTRMSVPALAYGEFLCAVFDQWVEKDIGTVKVQIFEEAARTAFMQEHTLCIFKKTCGGVPVIEQNGDFFSCDHYVDPSHRLGNIHSQKLGSLLDHPEQIVFGLAKEKMLPSCCRQCGVLEMCNGGCPKNRLIRSPDGEPGLNYLCEGYRLFFNHCKPFVDAVAARWN
jgi:uncharacterized protein